MKRAKSVLDAIDKLDSLKTRSGLAVWMRDNHDAFASRLAKKLPDWTVLANLFADAGLTDRYGNPPKPETARKTWQRVRKDVLDARAREPVAASLPPASKPEPVRRAAAGTRPPGPSLATVDEEPADDPPAKFEFKPSKPR